MTNCTQDSIEFPDCKRRHVEANFQGGDITSDGRMLRFRRVTTPTRDELTQLTHTIAKSLAGL